MPLLSHSPPHPKLPLGSGLDITQLTCYRDSETERQSTRASSMNREYSALPLPLSHRDQAWAGVSPKSGPVKS